MLDLFEGEIGPGETLRFIEDKLVCGIWKWDIATGDMEWSQGFFTLIGLRPNSVKPSFAEIQQRIHPLDRFSGDELSEVLQAGVPLDREWRVIRPNGRMRWIASRVEALFDPGGRVRRAIGISWDVTKQREQSQNYRSVSARFEALLSSFNGLAWLVDRSGGVTKLLKGDGSAESQYYLFEKWIDFVHPDDRAAVERELVNSRAFLGRYVIEHRAHKPNGLIGWTRTVVIPVMDDHKVQQEWVFVSTDINLERQYLPADAGGPSYLTGSQIRAARGILTMSVKELADASQVSPSTIRRYEEADGPNENEPPLARVHAALAERGIEFTFSRDGEPGVRPRSRIA